MRQQRTIVSVSCCFLFVMMLGTSALQADPITGSGTDGRISKFTGPYTIGDSAIFQSTSGYLGVGTTSPAYPLHISSSVSNPLFLQASTAGMTLAMKDNATTSSGQAIARIGDMLDFRTMDQARMVIREDGRIGIGPGAWNPQAWFHIHSGNNATPALFQTSTAGMAISLKDNATTGAGQTLVKIGDRLELQTLDQSRMFIREDGRVGIGPLGWNPQAWFHVDAGAWGTCALFQSSTAAGMTIRMMDSATTHSDALARIGNTLELRTLNTPRLIVAANGNVGIGGASLGSKLDVLGTARVTGMLTASGGAVVSMSSASGTTVVEVGGRLYRLASSLRYKTAVRDLEENPEAVLQLRPVRFNWASNGQPDIGLVAEEVDKVLPNLVIYDSEGRPEAVKYDRVPVYLLQLVREQQSRITTLEERLKVLEETVARRASP